MCTGVVIHLPVSIRWNPTVVESLVAKDFSNLDCVHDITVLCWMSFQCHVNCKVLELCQAWILSHDGSDQLLERVSNGKKMMSLVDWELSLVDWEFLLAAELGMILKTNYLQHNVKH